MLTVRSYRGMLWSVLRIATPVSQVPGCWCSLWWGGTGWERFQTDPNYSTKLLPFECVPVTKIDITLRLDDFSHCLNKSCVYTQASLSYTRSFSLCLSLLPLTLFVSFLSFSIPSLQSKSMVVESNSWRSWVVYSWVRGLHFVLFSPLVCDTVIAVIRANCENRFCGFLVITVVCTELELSKGSFLAAGRQLR